METEKDLCLILENVELEEVPLTEAQFNEIFNMQQTILEMMAARGKSDDILKNLCLLAEHLLPGSVASIMLKDLATGLMSVLTAPSIPQAGHDALANLKPGPGGGSCGNAVFRNEPQFVKDTFTDDRWSDLRHIAYDFNLCSCWSMPVRDEHKEPIGTFALSSFEHRTPSSFHKKLLETAASIVNIVLHNQFNEKRVELFSTATQDASEGMIITNKENKIIEVNGAFESIYGYKEASVLNKEPKLFASGRHDKLFYKKMWASIKKEGKWSGEVINRRSNGTEITQWMSISVLKDEKGEAENYLAIFSDLTQLKESQKQVEYMAYHDTLTQLLNITHLEKIINTSKIKSLILLNIDNFSYINTAYGFEIGDLLLKDVALHLKKIFPYDYIYRVNADEFALLFEEKRDIEPIINMIQNYFYSTTLIIEEVTLNISFTYGATVGEKNLLQHSALALKQAKESGKNRFHIFNEDEHTIDYAKREAFIASNNLVHEALEKDTFVTYFQGIYNNQTKQINKFEVLVRIIKDGKVISPITFLQPAQLSGLLPEITKKVIDKSFNIMAEYKYTFSINISEDDLSRSYLCDYLDQKCKEYAIDPSRVILEILEGVSAGGKKSHVAQFNRLKAKGFSLAIDDFGAEYSNFERILDLDIDYIKIDSKYIKDIDTNPKSLEVARAIAYFAKNAKISCVAEFVHSQAIQKIVEDLGIEYSQGYFFSEPQALPLIKKLS